MYGNRDQTRQVFIDVWNKMQQQRPLEPMEGLIAGLLEEHPEYHALLDQGEQAVHADFSPQDGLENPFLHLAMHIALREQAATDRPAGIRSQHERLSRQLGVHAAEHAMMDCLGEALWTAQRNGGLPDEQGYIDCLKKL